MLDNHSPYIHSNENLREITLRGIVLAIGLALILATSNAYLALKLGMLTSASIPAAIISMGILRFCKGSNVLENNLVQTAASAGEAVAGGIVYTIPALIIIHYWHGFDYWNNFLIALFGGLLGVLFSIPLRRVLVTDKHLKFPEGQAIAQVLTMSDKGNTGFKEMLQGGAIGASLEFFQTGLHVISSRYELWFSLHRSVFGFGTGFSATMVGAGYLIGFEIACSILLGAILGWLIAVPLVAPFFPSYLQSGDAASQVLHLWNDKIRYIGIGAMLFAGVWTFLTLLKPLYQSIRLSVLAIKANLETPQLIVRTEHDMPLGYLVLGIVALSVALLFFLHHLLPIEQLALSLHLSGGLLVASLLYILIIGFIFSAITGYFSGMVGVSASPGSSVIIAGMLLAAILLYGLLDKVQGNIMELQLLAAEATTIIVGSIITGIAAIANDNIQDLKVGHLLGATPWKQQVMLMLGVVVAAAIIPWVMQLMFSVYGIADVLPREGMDISQSLPAPPAALMAAITRAVFHSKLPWNMFFIGMVIILGVLLLNASKRVPVQFSILGVGMGIYLPLSTSMPLVIGGFIALWTRAKAKRSDPKHYLLRYHRGVLTACGLVVGATLMDVVLAIPFAMSRNPQLFTLVGPRWYQWTHLLGLASLVLLGWWFYYQVCNKNESGS